LDTFTGRVHGDKSTLLNGIYNMYIYDIYLFMYIYYGRPM